MIASDPNPSMVKTSDVASSTTTTPREKSLPSSNLAPPLSTSAADRRRQAALKMYNSSEMVPDNVDDVRLGTIDAVISPPTSSKYHHGRDKAMLSSWMKAEPLNEVGRVTSFGSSTSRARTDITTSSVVTARMGGSGRPSPRFGKDSTSPSSKEFSFSDVAAASALVARTHTAAGAATAITIPPSSSEALGSSPTTMAMESPAAQRRLLRAVERQQSSDGVPLPTSGLKSPIVPSAMSPHATPTTREMI